MQVSTKHIQSTQVDGEHVQLFKDLKLTMDNYVLHSGFYALDMKDVDIILGYPWMDSIGTININVQKKFPKLWYKKKKVTLQDIPLSQLVASKVVHDIVSVGTLEVIPIDTSYDKSMEEDTKDDTTTQEYMTQDVHQSIKVAPREPQVVKVTKEAPQVKIASYHHQHHPTRQKSFWKKSGNQQSYLPRWPHRGYQQRNKW